MKTTLRPAGTERPEILLDPQLFTTNRVYSEPGYLYLVKFLTIRPDSHKP